MRIDDYLSTVGVIKRRTIAKKLSDSGMIEVNGKKAKAAYQVKIGDVVAIKGTRSQTVEVISIPAGSVPKDQRDRYFLILPSD